MTRQLIRRLFERSRAATLPGPMFQTCNVRPVKTRTRILYPLDRSKGGAR